RREAAEAKRQLPRVGLEVRADRDHLPELGAHTGLLQADRAGGGDDRVSRYVDRPIGLVRQRETWRRHEVEIADPVLAPATCVPRVHRDGVRSEHPPLDAERGAPGVRRGVTRDRKSTRLNSSHEWISY